MGLSSFTSVQRAPENAIMLRWCVTVVTPAFYVMGTNPTSSGVNNQNINVQRRLQFDFHEYDIMNMSRHFKTLCKLTMHQFSPVSK